ncbi:MAG TPA: alpha/beta hydrolase [Chloroflexia bacterium]|nr:alpha/beta hydrolase [Chloroflexia bacterium]
MSSYEYHFIITNGITLHVVQAGPQQGPLVILLHGFPEFWYGWRKQIDYLAEKGYRVWAPDQRGYNLSEKPPKIKDYRVELLAKDIAGLIEAAGREKAYIAGHDWGAMVAWNLAISYPEKVEKLAILNVPHPEVMRHALTHRLSQLVRSTYAIFFQIPWLPEKLTGLNNWMLGTRAMKSSSRPGTFSESDLEQYRQAWSQPGAMTSMLNWYRASVRYPPRFPSTEAATVKVPTLIIWGAKDLFLKAEMAQQSLDYCQDGQLKYFEQATHWVQHEEAVSVNQLLADFFSQP